MALAAEARQRAYAPYSRYQVGAAVRTPDGSVYVGCNVENASYGLTVCAERVAVFSAVAAGHTRVTQVAIMTPSRGAPCGACRQVLLEFGGADLLILLADPEGGLRERRLADLLPEAFGPDDLRAANS
ncbi:MAG: cytidine deaminase [Planctomycetota bacterium]|nr:MAG: cytidine deaminase [Planctomycetota bacterium]